MSLTIERTSPTTLTIRRRFKAPPARVFAAHVEPALIQRWCYGFEGWRMPVCINDARPGGELRWEWANDGAGDEGEGFHVTGTYESVEPPEGDRPGRIRHVERMHLPDPTPDNHIETTFAPDGPGANPGTLLTVVMRVDSPEAMEAMIATGMTDGMEVTYARIDTLDAEAA